jgi:lipopolysaccharide/colanic/teichoic acid biosynthesis glycosyltransferase
MSKRVFDLFAACLLLILLSPLLLVLLVLQWLIMGRPLFFRQLRAGLDGQSFNMIKLRTMRAGAGSDNERLTRWGRILRATSFDELPELLHVISGKMSLVGPRPLPVQYLPRYSEEQRRRHAVRPGISGWAQVNGRNTISWNEQLAMDVWYVDNRTFALDLKILLLTIIRVFSRSGISAEGEATRSEFNGPNPPSST